MKISVILPYRNEAPFIRTCLESLARQTLKDFELIAVDDGSTDSSPAIVESFKSRFRHLVQLETGGEGLVPALNAALSRAGCAAIARADGDDLYHPRRLEAQYRLLERGVDVAGCLVRFFPRSGLMEGFRIYERWINRLRRGGEMASEIFVENPIAHPSLLMRRPLIEALGGYRDEGWPEDFDLMLRAHLAGAVFGKVPEVLHFWREHPERLCRTDPRYGLEAFIRCRCHHLARGPLRNRKRLLLWGAGPIGKKTAACLLREGIDFEAFIDIDPKKIGGMIQGRKVRDPAFVKKNPCFVLACVGKRGARYLVKSDLEAMGFRDTLDFILAA
jgi:glycosyltransferase involved in cell wall biosynthesis